MKKARTLAQKQRYPGGHIEVWHQSPEGTPSKERLCGTSAQAKTEAECELAQPQPSCISLTPDRSLSAAQDIRGSTTIPIYNWWPSYQATFLEQGSHRAQDSSRFQSSPPMPTALSLSTHFPAQSTSFSTTTGERYGQVYSETPSPSATWVDTTSGPGLLLESRDFTPPKQIESVDLWDDLLTYTQTYEDPTFDPVGFPRLDFSYFPWTLPSHVVMGGGDQFPKSQEVAAFSDFALVCRPEEDRHQPLLYHGSGHMQHSDLTPVPNCLEWTDTEIPAQPFSQNDSRNCISASQPFGQLDIAPYEDQMSHMDHLALRPRQFPQNPHPGVAGDGEEILTVCEDTQGTAECTCETQSPNTHCSSCSSSPQSWVMVTYKLAKRSNNGKAVKKPPNPRRRLDEDARQQTCQTRELGACLRCKVQRVRCIPNSEDPSGPCEPCSRVALNPSRKVIHHIGCHRYVLKDIVLFRTSGSNVTNRWHSDQVRNVLTQGKTFSIEMMQDFVHHPFVCEVRKVASTGRGSHIDKTTRDWYDGTATIQREAVLEYALADVQKTMSRYKDYIRDSVLGKNCQPAITKVVEDFRETKKSHDTAIMGDVYEKAWAYFESLPSHNETWNFFYQPWPKGNKSKSASSVSDKEFLLGLFELQFALSKSLISQLVCTIFLHVSWHCDCTLTGSCCASQDMQLAGLGSRKELGVSQTRVQPSSNASRR